MTQWFRNAAAAGALIAAMTVAPVMQAPADNQLTAAEKQAGWTLLFDGRSLDGWKGYKRPDAAGTRWKVENGTLTLPANDGKDTRGARDIISTAAFDRFELTFDFRVAQGANSGVKYYVLEDLSSAIGHEYQIIDDERHPDAKIGLERQTASLYDVMEPKDRKLKPAGEWNTGRVVAMGPTVEHWLNGSRVLSYELGSPALKKLIADSKFKDVARFGTLQKGHILIQDHGDQVWYRNMKIRRLAGATNP
jgi:hypothetical protein